MKSIYLKRVLFTLFLILIISTFSNVYAVNYGSPEARINKNNSMINNLNNMNSIARSSFTDKYLCDLYETSYKCLSTNYQKEIQNFADNTILEGKSSSLSNYDKVLKFHDFIINNYYYVSHPEKVKSYIKNYDNPYMLLKEYKTYGKIKARSNGYASMLIALSRSQGIPARIITAYYNKDVNINYSPWGNDITEANTNQTLVALFVNNKWIIVNPSADSYKKYLIETHEYLEEDDSVTEELKHKYFDPDIDTLSTTHILFKTYIGSKNIAYISNNNERSKLISFLNKSSNKKTNGKRINSSYNTSNSKTWFTNNTSSITDGNGNLVKINWPLKKGLVGALDLTNFSKLESLYVPENNLTYLKISNTPNIKSVSVYYNSIKTINITGSNKLTFLSAKGNPATYIKYNYNYKTATIKASRGGTVGVRYSKEKNKYKHELVAYTNKDYKFKGWYNGNKRISTKSRITIYRNSSFTYTAKYQKKPLKTYVVVSISKQKLWYYKNGKLKLTSKVVTGQKGKYSTPKKTYKILGKARSVYLVGPGYRSYVNYWILIDRRNQIGLHDASLRSKFGGSIYKYNGSHGCVNMPYKNAKYVYKYIPVGTKVIVK